MAAACLPFINPLPSLKPYNCKYIISFLFLPDANITQWHIVGGGWGTQTPPTFCNIKNFSDFPFGGLHYILLNEFSGSGVKYVK